MLKNLTLLSFLAILVVSCNEKASTDPKKLSKKEAMRCRNFNGGFERCENKEVVCYSKFARFGNGAGTSCWRK